VTKRCVTPTKHTPTSSDFQFLSTTLNLSVTTFVILNLETVVILGQLAESVTRNKQLRSVSRP